MSAVQKLGSCVRHAGLQVMSISIDATSKKRKFHRNEATSSHKARIVPSSNAVAELIRLNETGSAPAENVNYQRGQEDRTSCPSAGTPKGREDFSGGLTVKGERHEEGAKQKPPDKPKDKAALRQARSERRSTKKKQRIVAAVKTVAESQPRIQQTLPTRDGQTEHQKQGTPSGNPSNAETKQRFIVFVGNLPYSATTSTIRSHFSKLQPFTVRHSTDKESGRSRGFAFLEFDGYHKMKTCLKLYHHSLFHAVDDQGVSPAGEKWKRRARKINVELTAGGGGGKSAARQERIRGKNQRLKGERERAHRGNGDAAVKGREKKAEEGTGANATRAAHAEVGNGNVHPSRRKRLIT